MLDIQSQLRAPLVQIDDNIKQNYMDASLQNWEIVSPKSVLRWLRTKSVALPKKLAPVLLKYCMSDSSALKDLEGCQICATFGGAEMSKLFGFINNERCIGCTSSAELEFAAAVDSSRFACIDPRDAKKLVDEGLLAPFS